MCTCNAELGGTCLVECRPDSGNLTKPGYALKCGVQAQSMSLRSELENE